MSEGVVYSVSTRYKNEGLREATSEAEKGHAVFERLGESLEHAEGMFERLQHAALAFVGFEILKNKVEGLIHTFIELNAESESLQIQIAGMFQAGGAPGLTGADKFNKAMDASSELIAKMRKDARELPGEFQDLMNILQPMLATGIGTGRSINQIEAFSSRMMATTAAMHIPSAVAGHELEGLLMGRAANIMPLWRSLKPIIAANTEQFGFLSKAQREGLKNLETTAQVWKQLSVDQRMTLLLKATDALQPAIDRVATAWTTVESTAEDYYKNIMRTAGAPVFEEMKKILGEINKYYEDHKAEIDHLAETLGTKLADRLGQAFEYVKAIFGFIDSHRDSLALLAGVAQAGFIANRMGALFGGGGHGGPGGSRASGVAQAMLGGSGFGQALRLGLFGGSSAVDGGGFLRGMAQLRAASGAAAAGTAHAEAVHALRMDVASRSSMALGNQSLGMLDIMGLRNPMGARGSFWAGGKAGLAHMGRSELSAIAETGWSPTAMIAPAVLGAALTKLANKDVSDLEAGFGGLLGAVGSLPGPIGQVAKGLEVLYIGLQAAAGWFDKVHKDSLSKEQRSSEFGRIYRETGDATHLRHLVGWHGDASSRAMWKADTDPVVKEARDAVRTETERMVSFGRQIGVFANDKNQFDPDVARTYFRGFGADEQEVENYTNTMRGAAQALNSVDPKRYDYLIGRAKADSVLDLHGKTEGKPGGAKGSTVNIYQTNNIYEADDPDRIRVVIKDGLEDALYHPTRSSTGPLVGK